MDTQMNQTSKQEKTTKRQEKTTKRQEKQEKKQASPDLAIYVTEKLLPVGAKLDIFEDYFNRSWSDIDTHVDNMDNGCRF